MESIALHNLGCKVNGYELDVMQQRLQEKGFRIVPFDEPADIYIVNTCTVTNIADRKSRQMLHRAKKNNPKAIVVAVGCYVQTGQKAIEKDPVVDLAIGNNRKKDLAEILEKYLEQRRHAAVEKPASEKEEQGSPVFDVIDIGHTDEYEEMTLRKTAEHTRAYVKIQDGCNQFCSYCIIPYARGRVRSRQEENVLREVRGIVDKGYREIVLTGIHISSYGLDRGGTELLRLLHKLHGIEGLERIRISSLEPRIITEEFVRQISGMDKICPHFHLSLQSGCDSVLKRMNRQYDCREYLEKTELLRSYYDEPAITTDIIVGFPGETEEEFHITEEYVKRVCFYEMHIFKYSKRQGTRAAMMDGQITEAEKSRRSAILIETGRAMSHTYRERFIGREAEVLFEDRKQIAGKRYWIGHTPQYVKVAKAADGAEDLSNRIVKVVTSGFLEEDVLI